MKSRSKGKSGASLADVSQKKWYFFDQMQFLEERNVAFDHVSSLDAAGFAKDDSSSIRQAVMVDFGIPLSQQEEEIVVTDGTAPLYTPTGSNGINSPTEKHEEDGRYIGSKAWSRLDQRKRKKTDQSGSRDEERARRTDAIVAAANSFSNGKYDECVAIGNFVTAKLIKLSVEKRAEAECHIVEYLNSITY